MRIEDYAPYTPPGKRRVEAMTNELLENFERLVRLANKAGWKRVEIKGALDQYLQFGKLPIQLCPIQYQQSNMADKKPLLFRKI